jgi:hypothetical protein
MYNYRMTLRQEGAVWRVSVTRYITGGRGSASLYYGTRDSQSETRTFTTARKPLSAQGAWRASQPARPYRKSSIDDPAVAVGLLVLLGLLLWIIGMVVAAAV